jgi:hypothetical protein
MDRARDCRRLNQMVNSTLDRIERRQQQDPSRAETYEWVALQYESLAHDLGRFKTKDQTLAQVVSEYQVLVQSVGHSATRAASSMRIGNPGAVNDARVELSNERQSQQALNRQIETACRAQ